MILNMVLYSMANVSSVLPYAWFPPENTRILTIGRDASYKVEVRLVNGGLTSILYGCRIV